jgi:hypothetical protein
VRFLRATRPSCGATRAMVCPENSITVMAASRIRSIGTTSVRSSPPPETGGAVFRPSTSGSTAAPDRSSSGKAPLGRFGSRFAEPPTASVTSDETSVGTLSVEPNCWRGICGAACSAPLLVSVGWADTGNADNSKSPGTTPRKTTRACHLFRAAACKPRRICRHAPNHNEGHPYRGCQTSLHPTRQGSDACGSGALTKRAKRNFAMIRQ